MRQDLSFIALDLSRKVKTAELKNLKEVNRIIDKQVLGRENEII